MKIRGLLVASAIGICGVACDTDGCNDNYDPTDSASCSYNPELAGIAEAKDANVGQAVVPDALGGGYVYLAASPPTVASGSFPRITLINSGEVDIGYGSEYKVVDDFGHEVPMKCMFTFEARYLQPRAESDTQDMQHCLGNRLKPGTYEVSKQVTLSPGDDEESLDVTTTFTVVDG